MGGAPMALGGGGIVTLLIVLAVVLLGGNLGGGGGGLGPLGDLAGQTAGTGPPAATLEHCQTGADANGDETAASSPSSTACRRTGRRHSVGTSRRARASSTARSHRLVATPPRSARSTARPTATSTSISGSSTSSSGSAARRARSRSRRPRPRVRAPRPEPDRRPPAGGQPRHRAAGDAVRVELRPIAMRALGSRTRSARGSSRTSRARTSRTR